MTVMYNEWDIRKEIKRLEKLMSRFKHGSSHYRWIESRVIGIKWVLGE